MRDLVPSSPPRPASSQDEARTPEIDFVPSSRSIRTRTRDEGLEQDSNRPDLVPSSPGRKRAIGQEDLPALALDHGRFLFELTELSESGQRVPCVGDGRWISDDRSKQAAAARECLECPALAACRRYLDRWHEPAGVWAGLTERDRDGRRANGGKTARRAS